MRKIIVLIALISGSQFGAANESEPVGTGHAAMTRSVLHTVIARYGTGMKEDRGLVQFIYNDAPLLCICDPEHDRMRLVSPVLELKDVRTGQMAKMMEANFHTALDARYATSNGIVYAVYVHPLSTLTEKMVHSAMAQVSILRNTFGSSYHSGNLAFPKK